MLACSDCCVEGVGVESLNGRAEREGYKEGELGEDHGSLLE
jgi:hypothetical protein